MNVLIVVLLASLPSIPIYALIRLGNKVTDVKKNLIF